MSAMTNPTTHAPALPAGHDPYSAYGQAAAATKTFVTFKNGEYLYGPDDEEIPLGTRFIANMPGLRIGWKRWHDGKVIDDRMDLLVSPEGQVFKPGARADLGDLDPALWEKDEKTKQPKDPWQFTNELTLVGPESGTEFVFATASKGGIGAVGRLCQDYGRLYRQKPGRLPVIELQADSYQHKTYGKTYFPVLTLVDWVAESAMAAPVAGEADRVEVAPPPKAPEPEKPKRTRF